MTQHLEPEQLVDPSAVRIYHDRLLYHLRLNPPYMQPALWQLGIVQIDMLCWFLRCPDKCYSPPFPRGNMAGFEDFRDSLPPCP